MISIPKLHNIYCSYFHLKHEGMNYIVDNFKSSRIIGVTNTIKEKISNIFVCPKKCLNKCKDKLWITYEYFQGLDLWIASRVYDLWASFRNFFSQKTCMSFICQLHNIYCLYFDLKHEYMNYIVDNFKISRIIRVTNMIVEKISHILVCPKKCLSKCRYRLQLTYVGEI